MFIYRNENKNKYIYNEYPIKPRVQYDLELRVLYNWLNYLKAFWSDSFTLKKKLYRKKNWKKLIFSP
jgi:hypothetical protein